MKTGSFVLSALLLATPLAAQIDTRACPPGNVGGSIPNLQRATQDACQKALDLFQYIAPQLGVAITGGNATLGQGGTMGGLGHFSIGLRANGLLGSLPEIARFTLAVTGAESATYGTRDQLIGLPTADLAVGLFRGLPLGVTNVGGVDLIVSAAYLPEFDGAGVQIKVPGGPLKLGFGARVGLLQESLIAPGVSVTYLKRDLPTVDITAGNGVDALRVDNLEVRTDAWRVVASKSLLAFGLAIGGGRDRYKTSADLGATVGPRPPFTGTAITVPGLNRIERDLTRTNLFADLSLNLPFFRLTGEIGRVSGGRIDTFNKFEGKQAADARFFGSVGARFGF